MVLGAAQFQQLQQAAVKLSNQPTNRTTNPKTTITVTTTGTGNNQTVTDSTGDFSGLSSLLY